MALTMVDTRRKRGAEVRKGEGVGGGLELGLNQQMCCQPLIAPDQFNGSTLCFPIFVNFT